MQTDAKQNFANAILVLAKDFTDLMSNYAAKKKYLLISDIIKNSDFSIRHHGFLLKGQRDFKLKLLDTPLAVYRKRPAYGFGAFLGSIKADTAHCST